MAEEPEERTRNSEDNFRFLRRQVLLFQGFALHLAEELGLAPEEAGRRFWQGLSGTRTSRSVNAAELARIARVVAEDTGLIYGDARLEQVGEGWRVETTVSDQDRSTLERWGVSLEYLARWLGAVQEREGESIETEWTTRLEGNVLVQELMPRASGVEAGDELVQ